MKNKLLHSFRLRATMLVAMMLCVVNAAWAETYSLTPDQTSTGSNATAYITTLTEFTYSGISWKMNQWNPKTLQIKANQASAANEFRFYNTSAFPGKITQVVITFSALTVSDTSKLMFLGGTSEVTTTTDGTAGTWNATAKTLTWTPGASDNFTYFAFYQDGKAASGTNYLADADAIVVTYEGSSSNATATTTTIDDSGITNTDVYTSTAAGTLAATVTAGGNAVDGATVTWSGNNDAVATIAADGTVTLVAAGTVTFTANYAGVAGTYQSSSDTYEMTVTSSAPYVQPTEFDIALNNTLFGTSYSGSVSNITDANPITGSQVNVTVTYAGSGNHYVNDSQIRFYPNNKLTFEAPSGYNITKIVLSAGDTWTATISANAGTYTSGTKTWTGEATSVLFTGSGSGQCRMTGATITLAAESTDPSISADYVNIAYDATGGSFDYTINNPVQDGVVSVDFDSEGDWLLTATDNNGTVSFTCTANATNAEREAVVQIIYTYNNDVSVTKEVLITQAAAPVIYTTIPALFDAATNTETDVTVTFGGWVVSAVKNANAYLTDNQGNGLIIYASSHGFQVNDVLTGTVNCKLKLYNGSAEFTNLTTSTEGLTVTNNGSVTAQNIAISELGGVNTGALLSFEGLSYNGTALVDGNSNTITPYNTLYSGTFENGKSYNVTGIYLQYNTTKEILPRSAADIEEVVSSEPSITVAQTTVNVTATDDNGTIGITYANLSINDMNDFGIQYCDAQGNELSQGSEPTWIDVLVAEDNSDYVVSYTMDENTSTDARSAYFKVFAMGDADFVYSDLITVTQAGVVVDYATLPFEFDGGKSAIESTNGLTQEGLGNDYSDPNALLKFDSTGDHVILKINERPGTLSFNIKNNSFSGGTFKVQTSDDGETYQDLKSYTEINGTQNESINLDENVRYIKWIYTEKVSGNVGIGIIKVTSTESVTVTSAGYAAIVTKNNVSFYNSEVTAYIVTATATDQATLTEVEEAPAGTPLIVKAAAGTYNLTVINDATNVSGNLLQASNGTVKGDGSTIFALGNKDGVGFYVVGDGVTVPAGKPYLEISGSAGIKSFLAFNFGITTAISSLDAQKAERGTIYNLAGQRVNKAVKGIFIQNGKKVVVK